MQTKKIKNLLQLTFVVLLCSIFIWSCGKKQEMDQELEVETLGEKIISKVSLDEFHNSISEKNFREIKKYFQSNDPAIVNSRRGTENDFIILTNTIVKTEKEDKSFFTFQLRKEGARDEFYNLVLTVNKEQEIIRSEVYEYLPSTPYSSKESSRFIGSVRTYADHNIDVSTLIRSRSSGDCVVDAIGSWECSFGNNHSPGECNGSSFNYIIQLIYGPCPPSTEPQFVEVEDNGGGSGPFTLPSGGGGSTNTNNDDTNPINTTPINDDPVDELTDMERIMECMNTFSINGPNLAMPADLQAALAANRSCQGPLEDFLENEGCTYENKSFAIEAAKACLSDGEVDYDDKIILDSTFANNEYVKCIFDRLKSTSTSYKDAIQNFDGEFPVAHLKFNLAVTDDPDANAATYPPQDYVIEIRINPNKINRPALSIARTFVHETIHAEMWRKIMSMLENGADLDGLTASEWRQRLANGDFPGIFDFYTRFGVNGFQHEQMAAHYRGFIENILREYDPNQTDEVYKALAWVGLHDTVAWNALSQAERDGINNTINTFNQNGSHDCN